jgi:hypothetical protein
MSRPRRFCGLCGRMIGPGNPTDNAPIAYCLSHVDLVGLDNPPPDPLESLPMYAADTLPGEDAPPATGTERC